jgi:chromosome segregation ATPase
MSVEMIITGLWSVITAMMGLLIFSLKGQLSDFKTEISKLTESLISLSGEHREQVLKHTFSAQVVETMNKQIHQLQQDMGGLREEILFLRAREHDLINAVSSLWGHAYINHGFKELGKEYPTIRKRTEGY